MFTRVQKQEQHVELDSRGTRDLKALLFGPVVGMEAVRLTRADAVVAAAKSSPSLAQEVDGEVRALIETEVASTVRDRLAAARLAR